MADLPPRFWVVVPAAGSARRMGANRPKQYLPLLGRPVLEWAVAPFLEHERCAAIVVVLGKDDPYWSETTLASHPRVLTAVGGAERAISVHRGLAQLRDRIDDRDWVLVHDAARPCLRSHDLHHLLTELASDTVGGLLAAPVVDTLKRANEQGRVDATIARAGLWRALTPQMFRYGLLTRALALSAARSLQVTDEAQAIELLGMTPKLVAGSADNLKITVPADLHQAAHILAERIADE